MSFANASMDEMEITKLRYLLCLVLLNINLFNALRLMIIALMHLLKHGYNVFFKAKDATHHWYRSVYSILGDHPSQALCAGMSPPFSRSVSFSPTSMVRHFHACNHIFVLQGWHRAAGVAATTATTSQPSSMRWNGQSGWVERRYTDPSNKETTGASLMLVSLHFMTQTRESMAGSVLWMRK